MSAFQRRIGRCSALVLGLLLSISQHAHAEVWGYIDEKGVPHFAAERLDPRYELFFKGDEPTDLIAPPAPRTPWGVAPVPAPVETRPAGLPGTTSKLFAFFDVSPGYKAVKHHIREAATQHSVDYELLQALIATESGFDSGAVSPKGAVGLMQLIPATAQRYGVASDKASTIERKLADPRTNVMAGTRYLRDLLGMFGGSVELALAAYNAGEGAVQRAGKRIPNYPETQNYVKTVMQLYQLLKPPPAVTQRRGPLITPVASGVDESFGAHRTAPLP